jgi:hypothetical protein
VATGSVPAGAAGVTPPVAPLEPPEATPRASPEPASGGRMSRLSSPDGTAWLFAILISAAISAGLSYVINSHAIPPGGDPGTWISTGIAYVGQGHTSQVIPLAYPPVLFPLLGGLYLLTGNAVTVGQVFAPLLYFFLGLSIFYLATQMLRSRVVALVAMTFLMLDPQLLQMIFWGAYPNLLAFVFMNVALAGLVIMGRGDAHHGGLIFWVFGALAVLTHSLAAVVLAGMVVMFLLLVWAVPKPTAEDLAIQTKYGEPDNPSRIPHDLFLSPGGTSGFIIFVTLVGAYYAVTALANVPHPSYFVSSPLAFHVIGLSGVLHAVFPGVSPPSLQVVYMLIVGAFALLFWYATVLIYRPAWLSTTVLVLLALAVVVLLAPVGGWMARIVTDYTRFGYFLLVPTGLSIAYLVDRGWIAARFKAETPGPAPAGHEPRVRRWLRQSRHPRRSIAFTIISFVVALLFAATITQAAMWHDEKAYTQVGHNEAFLNALRAIQATGQPGGILTVPGADKWARAITDRNVYAPYTQATYLFYASQVLDSDLSYYALTSHYAITNGVVSAYVSGVAHPNLNGTPSYGAYVVGNFRPILSAPPTFTTVELVGAGNGTPYSVPVSGSPQVLLPPAGATSPILLTYVESNFVLSEYVAVAPAGPDVTLTYSLVATGNDRALGLNVTLIPANYTTAIVSPGTFPGEFYWETQTRYSGPLTYGNVTPMGALAGVTPYYPTSKSPAVLLSFRNTSAGGGRVVEGAVSLSTPAASALFNVLPPVIVTTQVYSSLGIQFILMRNPAYAPNPSVAFPGEVQYLETEFGAVQIYANGEWTDLELPT